MEDHIETPTSSKDRGFTLVELLIVIVILGILATVTVFAVRGITDKGTESSCASDKKTLEVAVESYFAQYGGTAIQADGEVIAGSDPAVTSGDSIQGTLVNAGYLRSESDKFEVSADGKTIEPVDGGTCDT